MNKPSEELKEDDVIALAVCIYESQGYAENTFEMLNSFDSHNFIKQAEHLIAKGYRRTPPQPEVKEFSGYQTKNPNFNNSNFMAMGEEEPEVSGWDYSQKLRSEIYDYLQKNYSHPEFKWKIRNDVMNIFEKYKCKTDGHQPQPVGDWEKELHGKWVEIKEGDSIGCGWWIEMDVIVPFIHSLLTRQPSLVPLNDEEVRSTIIDCFEEVEAPSQSVYSKDLAKAICARFGTSQSKGDDLLREALSLIKEKCRNFSGGQFNVQSIYVIAKEALKGDPNDR